MYTVPVGIYVILPDFEHITAHPWLRHQAAAAQTRSRLSYPNVLRGHSRNGYSDANSSMFIHPTSLSQADLKSAIVRNPLVVAPDTTVMNAITQMSGVRAICSASRASESQLDELHIEARSSCVLIAENHQLLGILTERDVVRLSTQKLSLEILPVRDVMIHPVITLHESAFTDLFLAVNLLQQYRIRHLPILDEQNSLSGLLTHESLQQTSRPVDLLRLRLVAEVMTTKVICATPDSSMLAIAQLMTKHQVSCIVIVQEQDQEPTRLTMPIGIITERDIVQFQALNLDLETCRVACVMSTPVFSVRPTDSLLVVQQIMMQQFIRRLAVTGPQGELLGIVTQSSLLQTLNPLELYTLAEVLEQKVLRLEAEKIELLESRTTELEQQVKIRTAALKAKSEQESLIATVTAQIRSSLDVQNVLNTTVEKLQAILGCDRVALWQIQPDWQMMAVAESTSGRTNPQLGQQVYDPCFAPDWSEAYQKGRVRVVPDIYTTEMTDCHRALLERLQTRAKVLVPVIHGDTLWGLLEAAESDIPRRWQLEEVALLQQLATQLAIAIQQATAYQQAQIELTERRQTEARLRESEQRYATLTAVAPVGIFRTDAEGNYVYVNERWCSITGLTSEQAMKKGWIKGLHPHDQDKMLNEWRCAAQENRPFRLEYRFQRLDGTVCWVFGQAVAERNAAHQITGHVGTITDISDLKRVQELIVHNALHDPLTDLPNRTLLVERLELAINQTRYTENYRYAVLFLDLDRFKVINDSLGHLVGDQVLKLIAQKLKSHLRETDLIARLGGDEFVILLEKITGIEEVIQLAERMLMDCQSPLFINGYEMFTSLSIGIVMGMKRYQQASDLIRDADIALYRAKAQGKNSYKFFDAEMHTQAMNRLMLETDLHKALSRDEFVVYYQPIVDILNDCIVGFEALVRWQHPTRGFVSPENFIPIAEETGFIVSLDRWVMQTACLQLARWRTTFANCLPLKISINLSAQDLRQTRLVEEIDCILAQTGLEGDAICLEMTESMLIENTCQTIDLLTQLKARKIQISIDDFGTGYSSLNYLHRLPADNLKIDRSFVGQMQPGNRNYQVVNTIIALGEQLELTVVAEGIETLQQLQWLQQLGCQLGQGYLFSKPLTALEIEARLFNGKGRQFCQMASSFQ